MAWTFTSCKWSGILSNFSLQSCPGICQLVSWYIMGRSNYYKSPSTKLRSLQRLSKHLRKKLSNVPKCHNLTIRCLPSISILPLEDTKNLSIMKTSSISIINRPNTKNLSFSRPTICSLDPSSAKPQLDGHHGQEPPPAPSLPRLCPTCKYNLETEFDVTWHYETEIGRQDCSILKSMLSSW